MTSRVRALALACLLSISVSPCGAQSAQPLDYIVAVVNSEPITFLELTREVLRTGNQLAQPSPTPLSPDALRSQVLDRMINERAQLQLARETGIRIDSPAIDRAAQSVASQNGLDLPGLEKKLASDGIPLQSFRDNLRDQITLSRLRERDVESRIQVSDVDVDHSMLEQLAASTDPLTQEINLAQILVPVPEKANGEEAARLFIEAQKLLARARAGEDFAQLVQRYSSAERSNGGQIGLRRGDRLPPAFVEATRTLQVGEISNIVRTGAGFHILQLVERKPPSRLIRTIEQTRVRHILLRTGPALMTQAQAITRLNNARKTLVGGKSDFASLARSLSQDGSASQGGDLGWASPGMFVPEFEEAMARLHNEGDISPAVVSRFGVHLIQLTDRRRIELSPQQVRETVRNELRKKRFDDAYATWAQEVRSRAFVELREPPQ